MRSMICLLLFSRTYTIFPSSLLKAVIRAPAYKVGNGLYSMPKIAPTTVVQTPRRELGFNVG